MLSSRVTDQIQLTGKTATLSSVRRAIKAALESQRLFEQQVFQVWINEDAPAAEGSSDSWETCLRQVSEADIVLVLYNGNAGWAKEAGDIGICHAELAHGLATAPSKVRLVELPVAPIGTGETRSRNVRFRSYVDAQTRFRSKAANGDEAIQRCKEALTEAVVDMVHLGLREARRGGYYSGAALDWSRLDFDARRTAMTATLRAALAERSGSTEVGGDIIVQIAGQPILIDPHAVPAGLTVPGALDRNHPFQRDHTFEPVLDGRAAGPLHIFVCHRSVTEAQAIRQLGFPDATVVKPPFGVYLADGIQRIQMVFIGNCRDETSTRHGVQRFFEWLEQSGEGILLAERACARARVVQAIASA